MISTYRRALLQFLDGVCHFLALNLTNLISIADDLNIFSDYTGASLFTVFFYLLFFYIIDAYKVGFEDFKESMGRLLVACVLGILSSSVACYAFDHWRFDRETLV
ncbi:MAG: sugar transferase, partial [Desulfovibrio sp.]|nr:sugar transferase [Desulfovibrio sp.]